MRFGALVARHGGRRRWVVVAVVAALVVAAVAVGIAVSRPATVASTSALVPGVPEGSTPVELDTSLFLPAHTPAPAVLLAHGFGGSKTSMTGQAEDLARAGYVVLTWSARGFGASGGDIHLDAPAYEVADARTLVDHLATLPQVQRDGPGDPRVGVAGGSYGGALSLLLAGTDHRVDAVAADITWNDLDQALVPNGVFKRQWGGYLFQAGFSAAAAAPAAGDTSGSTSTAGAAVVACGRFAPDVCAAYQQLAATGTAAAATTALLTASSPKTVAADIDAPTLLTQGEDDSLFGLDQADANARQIAAHGTDVRVVWRPGGHDQPGTGTDVATSAARSWFDEHLRGEGHSSRSFELSRGGPRVSAGTQTTNYVGQTYRVEGGYPGIQGHPAAPRRAVEVSGPAQPVSAPAGGVPAAVTSLPGIGGLLGAAGGAGALSVVAGQTAAFTSAPLSHPVLVAGSPTVQLQLTALSSTDATLFLALRDVDPAGGGGLLGGGTTLPSDLVTPVRVTGLVPGRARTVTVRLPAIAYGVPAGHRLALTVGTTDQAYALPNDARSYLVDVASAVSVPEVQAVSVASTVSWTPWVVAGLVTALAVLLGLLAWWRRRARMVTGLDLSLVDVPVAVQDLVKSYRDGYRAVDGVSFVVERGQVVGLLGPNGAGKTSTLRVLMGLMRPTAGVVRVFGEPVLPGAPVLSRLGSFVEGPGFLPHLSGRANLELFWAATGRPTADARFDVAAQVAGLGTSVERRVKTYSQGMRQRLAIAQAMLGLPEVLVLDEPTNGLDPPQIAEMREVLRRYAETGRTVLLSSHLLAEVEQTCSHVVVMHRGKVVAAGTVADVAGPGGVQLAVDEPDRARAVLAAAGIATTAVPARRALEDVFLGLVGDPRADDPPADPVAGPVGGPTPTPEDGGR